MHCSKNRIIPLFERDVMAVEKLPERAAAAGIRWANPLRNPPDSDPVKPALRVRIAEPMSFDHS